jgi:hypothetical protein
LIDKDQYRHPDKPAHIGILTPPETRENNSELEYNLGDDYYGYDYLEDGYKGIGAMNYPGQHDDRPVIAIPLQEGVGDRKDIRVSDFDENYARFKIDFKNDPSKKLKKGKFSKFPSLADGIDESLDVTIGEENEGDDDTNFRYTDDLSALFGNTKFTLPTDGSFPEKPKPTSAVLDYQNADMSDHEQEGAQSLSSIMRDLPSPDGYKPKIPDIYGMNEENYAKHYLKNPFGSDFVRLEVDPDRYSHNKSLGIRHIPLKVNGYPTTMDMPSHPKKIPVFKRPSRGPHGKRKTPVRKRQLKHKERPGKPIKETTSSIKIPSTMEELKKLMEEERKLRNSLRPPPPKVKLMPFPAPPRNQQRPSLRVPKKGPIPPFKVNLNKLKSQHDSLMSSSGTHLKKKPSHHKHNNGPSPNTKNKPNHQSLGMNNLMKDAMVNLPNAIKSLPSFMQKLISNHASFVGSGRSFSDDFSLAGISDYAYEDDNEDREGKSSLSGEGSGKKESTIKSD